jgi:hypothetical protein
VGDGTKYDPAGNAWCIGCGAHRTATKILVSGEHGMLCGSCISGLLTDCLADEHPEPAVHYITEGALPCCMCGQLENIPRLCLPSGAVVCRGCWEAAAKIVAEHDSKGR